MQGHMDAAIRLCRCVAAEVCRNDGTSKHTAIVDRCLNDWVCSCVEMQVRLKAYLQKHMYVDSCKC